MTCVKSGKNIKFLSYTRNCKILNQIVAGAVVVSVLVFGGCGSNKKYMPENFGNIRLGMKLEDIKKIRPYITSTGVEGEMREVFKFNEDFRTAYYYFDEEDRLKVIYFYNPLAGSALFDKLTERAKEKLGTPDEDNDGRVKKIRRWRKKDFILTVSDHCRSGVEYKVKRSE
ncbi:MAG: hypothetical protein ABIJ82_00195 [Patescibacteria group bacterium]